MERDGWEGKGFFLSRDLTLEVCCREDYEGKAAREKPAHITSMSPTLGNLVAHFMSA